MVICVQQNITSHAKNKTSLQSNPINEPQLQRRSSFVVIFLPHIQFLTEERETLN